MTRRARETATYVYCAVQGRTAPSITRAPGGLPGLARPRTLDAGGGLWLVVADASLARYGAAPIERGLQDLNWVSRCALGHEAVIEHAAATRGVIPMKLFTLFSSDERAVAHVARNRKRIDRLLERVAGRAEWGVRLTLDERRAARGGDAGHRGTPTSGTDFLLRKKAATDAARQLILTATREADRVFDALARRGDDARRRTPSQGGPAVRVLLDAAFLVHRARAREFRAAAASLARGLGREGYELTLSGPWPPYNFVSETA